ncbi:hypothetical protein RND81_10G249000 [Saponaria officinalis]|uniref:BZIP domain-containing protein n=1 Tax=Saponaria officinalis TaxID=3572 RepID=A0AAW1I862_SAPOF
MAMQQSMSSEDARKLMKRKIANRNYAKKMREKKKKYIEGLESEGKKKNSIIAALGTHIKGLEDVVRSKDAIIQKLTEVIWPTIGVPHYIAEYDLRRRLLEDVCSTAHTGGISPHMVAPLLVEYDNGGPVDVPNISRFLMDPWNHVGEFHF